LVGYFGGIGRENKLDDAIRAVARVPGTQLLIWGWGEREYIKELLALAKGVGASNQIHFLGELTEPRWKWLEGLDLSLVLYAPNLLRLQYAATASNKLFESLRCAVPVVTFAEPDFLEFLKDHPIGWSVQPGSVEELAHLFRRLRADRPLLEKTRQLARQFHLKEFNYEAQFQKLIPRFDSFFPDTVRSTHTVAA
jgi:glycosyltransferase involved in cell wall biosynthesis